jgi:hypothetical protein
MEGAFTRRTVGVLDAGRIPEVVVNGDKSLVTDRMLLGDAIIAFLLFNEARRRIVVWVYGVPREDSEVMTVIAIGSLAEGLQSRARVIAAWVVPSFAATVMGAGALKEAANSIGGNQSRTVPAFGALITFAVVAKAFHPWLRASVRGLREGFHGVETGSRRFLEFVGGQSDLRPK